VIAAFCIAGEAECLTGYPYTAQKRVLALMDGAEGSDTPWFIEESDSKFKGQMTNFLTLDVGL
jgi:hypothetical protein